MKKLLVALAVIFNSSLFAQPTQECIMAIEDYVEISEKVAKSDSKLELLSTIISEEEYTIHYQSKREKIYNLMIEQNNKQQAAMKSCN